MVLINLLIRKRLSEEVLKVSFSPDIRGSGGFSLLNRLVSLLLLSDVLLGSLLLASLNSLLLELLNGLGLSLGGSISSDDLLLFLLGRLRFLLSLLSDGLLLSSGSISVSKEVDERTSDLLLLLNNFFGNFFLNLLLCLLDLLLFGFLLGLHLGLDSFLLGSLLSRSEFLDGMLLGSSDLEGLVLILNKLLVFFLLLLLSPLSLFFLMLSLGFLLEDLVVSDGLKNCRPVEFREDLSLVLLSSNDTVEFLHALVEASGRFKIDLGEKREHLLSGIV